MFISGICSLVSMSFLSFLTVISALYSLLTLSKCSKNFYLYAQLLLKPLEYDSAGFPFTLAIHHSSCALKF